MKLVVKQTVEKKKHLNVCPTGWMGNCGVTLALVGLNQDFIDINANISGA